jgi:hypothetical protein
MGICIVAFVGTVDPHERGRKLCKDRHLNLTIHEDMKLKYFLGKTLLGRAYAHFLAMGRGSIAKPS